MAKRKTETKVTKAKPKQGPWGKEDGRLVSDFIEKLGDDIEDRFGRRAVTESEVSERVLLGMPLDTLAQRLIFQSTVMPVGRVIHIYGPTESLKTCMSYEFMRLHVRMRGGMGFYRLVEQRDQPVLRNSIIEYKEMISKVRVIECRTMDEWQISDTSLIKLLEKRSIVDKVVQQGACPFPICLVVDSLVGGATDKTHRQIRDDGCAKPGFSEEAKSLNLFFKVVFEMMSPWPITWIGTNHEKYGTDKWGHRTSRTPGGAAMGFYTTFGLAMYRVRDYRRLRDAGRQVCITVDKNSLGDARTKMFVNFFWYLDDNNVQHSYWDWHDASIRYLRTMPNIIESKVTWQKRVEDIVDLEFHGEEKSNTQRVTSKKLGVTKASFHDAGVALEENPAIRNALDHLFGIHQGRLFVPGIMYAEQQELARQDVSIDEVIADAGGRDRLMQPVATVEEHKHDAEGLIETADGPEEVPDEAH